tara:strand:- start:268 stop:528 length:261 start_codon:yes stop_codon:yes gene_type:complete
MKNWIATLISIVILFFAATLAERDAVAALIIASSVILYWTYRFKKSEKKSATIDAKPDQLLKWNDLLAKGAITQEEYDKAKRDLLG